MIRIFSAIWESPCSSSDNSMKPPRIFAAQPNSGKTTWMQIFILGRPLWPWAICQTRSVCSRNWRQRRPDDPEIYYNLAMVYGKTGGTGDSHYYFGLYFKKKGKMDSALFHFKAALKEFSQNHPKSKEIQKGNRFTEAMISAEPA